MDMSAVYAQLHQQTKELMSHPLHPLWNQLNLLQAMQQMPTNAAALMQQQQQQQHHPQMMPPNPYALPGYGVDFPAWAMSANLPSLPFNSPQMQNMFATVNSPTPSPPFALSYPNTPTPDYHHLNLNSAQKQQLPMMPQHHYSNHINALMMQSAMATSPEDQAGSIYPCTICDKRFQKPWHLRTHLAGVHYQLRPHKCTECTMAFRSPYDLKRHQTTHTGERFECDHCNISFGSKQRIAKHIRENPSCWANDNDMEDNPSRVSAAQSTKIIAETSPSASQDASTTSHQNSSSLATLLSTPAAKSERKSSSATDSESNFPSSNHQSLHHSLVSDTDSDHTRTDFEDEDEPVITDV
uniref:C2H2-type domain-containing protein n=1 Tax=Plectus sambesii TaxID=2011161 RepID=A0A914UTG2_9BILA